MFALTKYISHDETQSDMVLLKYAANIKSAYFCRERREHYATLHFVRGI